jgi:hypothetical protein
MKKPKPPSKQTLKELFWTVMKLQFQNGECAACATLEAGDFTWEPCDPQMDHYAKQAGFKSFGEAIEMMEKRLEQQATAEGDL